MKFGILTHLNALNKLLTLVVLCGLTHAAMASTSLYNSLDKHLAVPMQQQAIMDSYQPRTPSKSTHTQHYTSIEANYAVQALRSGTRSVNSYGGGYHNQASNHVAATQLPATPHTGTPTAIRDINTWKRTRTTSPTLADDIALADDAIMQRIGGGSGPIIDSDKENTPTIVPLGDATWLLLFLAIGYAWLIRRKKMIIHTLNK